MAEYAYLVVYLPRGTSRDARDTARRILADHAEYGDWELSRLSLSADGSRMTPAASSQRSGRKVAARLWTAVLGTDAPRP